VPEVDGKNGAPSLSPVGGLFALHSILVVGDGGPSVFRITHPSLVVSIIRREITDC
jgi:hypothetical protein